MSDRAERSEEVSTLLSIDPGKRKLGWAFFEGRELVECSASVSLSACPVKAGLEHRAELGWLRDLASLIVCERMVVRYAAGGATRVSDTLDVNLIAGMVGRDEWWTPGEWKGSVPKPQHHKRVWAALSREESDVVRDVLSEKGKSAHLDILDAVGLGLARLGRIEAGSIKTWRHHE